MNSSLEQDYDEFKFTRRFELESADVEEENFQNLRDLLCCELCDQKFDTKKDLQDHLLAHISQPRVVLKRIPGSSKKGKKGIPSVNNNKFWSETEHKGTLKIKLKLKKSPLSEDFTVVSNNIDLDKYGEKEYELADEEKYDSRNDSEEEEKTTEQSFENVMLNQEDNYEDDDVNDNDNLQDCNPLETSERPLMDNNEGDSGVGSDTVNPLEREDQNVDDLQADNNSNSDHNELAENEDPEESDALEATYRETIENLKKLGELETRSNENLSPAMTHAKDKELEEEDQDQEEEETRDERENNQVEEEERTSPINPIEGLQSNCEISIVPKSALMPAKSSITTQGAETELVPIGGGSSSGFSWTKIVNENTSNDKSRENNRHSMDKDRTEEVEVEDENSADTNSILQNFLIEQQRNQNEPRDLPLETEYVSLEKLAETVTTCKVCNEKFKDIAHLDAHKSKFGHYQCSRSECSSLVFKTPMEVSTHKIQSHSTTSGSQNSSTSAGLSPHHLSQTHSPHSQSPHLSNSPLLNAHSPQSPNVQIHPSRNSPITLAPTNSSNMINPPTINHPHAYLSTNMDQLAAPVQQLAQQVQRMPLPQPTQLQPGPMPGGHPMMHHGPSYYQPPTGRPPMYSRVPGPHMGYPSNIGAAMYAQHYAAAAAAAAGNPYQQMGMQSQMPPQQMSRGRYPMVPAQRQQRLPQQPLPPQPPQPSSSNMVPMQRVRMKRPLTQAQVHQQQQMQMQAAKLRRMDVLLPDRNEDADCHVIAQQKRNNGLPVIQNVQGGTAVQQSNSNRSDSTIHLTDSITLSVRQPGHNSAQINANVQAKKTDTSAVANVLAARGITVTPASSKKNSEQSNGNGNNQTSSQQQQSQPKQSNVVSTLNLNSAISIIPAASQRKQQQQQESGQFAVPQNKQNKQVNNEVERPPRPPTVDLTQDNTPLQTLRRGRQTRMAQSLTCHICDKSFQSLDILNSHIATHRATKQLPHKCNLCPAQYPSPMALVVHKKTYHKQVDAPVAHENIELAIPIVDLKAPSTLARLNNLGIQSYIPLSQLSAMTGGSFGLPIVTIDGTRNPNLNNLAALGANSILSLGTLKHLSNR